MLPQSRQKLQYCEKFEHLDKYSWKEVLDVKDMNEFKRLFYGRLVRIYEHGHKKRYCWINLHSIFFRGTTEIRAHSGTINADKIKKWILIHLRIREYLNNASLEDLIKINPNKSNFLKLFDKEIQNYIQQRWNTFPKVKEEEFKEYE
jgi:hypothetical protein